MSATFPSQINASLRRPRTPRLKTCATKTAARSLWLVLMALFVIPTSAKAGGPTTLLEQPVLAGSDFSFFGQGMDVEGNFAVVSAVAQQEVWFFTRSIDTGQWNSGLSIPVGPVDAIGSPVALDDQIRLYYVAMVDSTISKWELRERIISISPSEDVVFTRIGHRMPDTLDVDGNLMVVGYRPTSTEVGEFAAYERSGENWLPAFSGLSGTTHSLGYSVATDGTRVVVTDPLGGPSAEGSMRVYRKTSVLPATWVYQLVLYTNVFQPNAVNFGSSVALDGDCLAVGMDLYNSGSPLVPGSVRVDSGGVQMYALDPQSQGWVAKQVLVPAAVLENDQFGKAVDLLGPNLVIGGENVQRTSVLTTQGDASYFARSGSCNTGVWEEQHRLRSTLLAFAPLTIGAYGAMVKLSYEAGAMVTDYLGPTGELHGRGYAFEGIVALFRDGFESGATDAWEP